MAIPQLRNEGVDQTGGSAAFLVDFSSFTWAVNDIIEVIIATDGWVPVLTTANGFALAQDPVGNTASSTTNGGVAGANDCGIFVYWKRATGTTTAADPPPVFQAPSVSSGTCWCLQPNSFSGARTSGTPYHAITTGIVSTATTAVSTPAVTSTLADCLFTPRVASATDDQAFNAWVMTGSASPSGTKPVDTGWHAPAGNQCAFVGDEGGFAAAGSHGVGTTTFATATKQAMVQLAMASLPEASTPTISGGSIGVAGTSTGSATALDTISGSSAGAAGASTGSVTTGSGPTISGGSVGNAGTSTGSVVVGGALTGGSLGGAGSSTGVVQVAASASGGSLGAAGSSTGVVNVASALSIGAAGIRQKANGTTPASGTLSSFGVYPAWTPSTVYTLDQAVRVTNAGNCYELVLTNPTANGTSASSGGPTGTGANIADGSCNWNFLFSGTGACDTQATGSLILFSGARGVWNPPNTLLSDNKSNTLTTVSGPNFYSGFPASASIVQVAAAAAGGTGHTCGIGFAGNDECTAMLIEVKGGTRIQASAFAELAPVSNVITAPNVVTTGPAMIITFWWLNGTVRTSGTKHPAVIGGGATRIEQVTALMELSPGGAGEVQVTASFMSTTTPGTYSGGTCTTTLGEGSQVYVVAVQGPTVSTINGGASGAAGTSTGSLAGTVGASGGSLGAPGASAGVVHDPVQTTGGSVGDSGTSTGSVITTTVRQLTGGSVGDAGVSAGVIASPRQLVGGSVGDSGVSAGSLTSARVFSGASVGAAGLSAGSLAALIATSGGALGAAGSSAGSISTATFTITGGSVGGRGSSSGSCLVVVGLAGSALGRPSTSAGSLTTGAVGPHGHRTLRFGALVGDVGALLEFEVPPALVLAADAAVTRAIMTTPTGARVAKNIALDVVKRKITYIAALGELDSPGTCHLTVTIDGEVTVAYQFETYSARSAPF